MRMVLVSAKREGKHGRWVSRVIKLPDASSPSLFLEKMS
jgi:hypothetical protein